MDLTTSSKIVLPFWRPCTWYRGEHLHDQEIVERLLDRHDLPEGPLLGPSRDPGLSGRPRVHQRGHATEASDRAFPDDHDRQLLASQALLRGGGRGLRLGERLPQAGHLRLRCPDPHLCLGQGRVQVADVDSHGCGPALDLPDLDAPIGPRPSGRPPARTCPTLTMHIYRRELPASRSRLDIDHVRRGNVRPPPDRMGGRPGTCNGARYPIRVRPGPALAPAAKPTPAAQNASPLSHVTADRKTQMRRSDPSRRADTGRRRCATQTQGWDRVSPFPTLAASGGGLTPCRNANLKRFPG